MAKTRAHKESRVEELTGAIRESKAVVFANFQGLTVSAMDELRAKCREAGMTVTATKKTLLKRALKEAGIEVDTKAFEGGVATVLGQTDEVAPAQTVAEFAKGKDVVTIFGGILEGNFIDAAKVTELAKLPSKQQLLGQVVGTINAPVSGFVNVLAGNIRGLANVLNAIKEAKA